MNMTITSTRFDSGFEHKEVHLLIKLISEWGITFIKHSQTLKRSSQKPLFREGSYLIAQCLVDSVEVYVKMDGRK